MSSEGRTLCALDRVALGRCRPRAPTDPYVLALEHTVPRITGSLRACKLNVRHRHSEPAGIAGGGVETRPVQRAMAVAAVKPLPPATLDFLKEPGQRRAVTRDTVVRVVSA